MARFYVSSTQVQKENGTVILEGQDAIHFGNVLRAKKGDKCEVISGDGSCFQCSVSDFFDGKISLTIECESSADYEPKVNTVVYQCVPKGEKSELIIQKSVELGVNKIVPVLSERSVVKINSQQDAMKKAERWNKISEGAAKQCGRGYVPEIACPVTMDKIDFNDKSLKILAYENETERTLKAVLEDSDNKEKCLKDGISVFIGPEGGISPKEYDYLTSKGFISVTLGKRILRAETAPIMFLSSLRFYFED